MPAHGNDKVILALEQLLAEARAGKHGYLIAMMIADGKPPMAGAFGTSSLEEPALKMAARMVVDLDAAVTNKRLPPRNLDIPADRVCYNVPRSPMSYDFCCWLIDAELRRRMAGAPAPLKVHFWFGRDGKTGLETPHRKQMFLGVVQPMLDLIGAVEDDAAADGYYRPAFSSRHIAKAARDGAEIPRFKAPRGKVEVMARPRDNPVTITLRESALQPCRNSNMDAWLKFASYLKNKGENVIFVRDTAKAGYAIDGFDTFPAGSIDLHWRMALYEIAKMNLFVSNGPATLGYFSDFPWLTFVPMADDACDYEPLTPKFWREQVGIEMGEQLPWSRPNQRIVWKADDYANLVEAWEQWCVVPPDLSQHLPPHGQILSTV
jgi:hypothetical protein